MRGVPDRQGPPQLQRQGLQALARICSGTQFNRIKIGLKNDFACGPNTEKNEMFTGRDRLNGGPKVV